MKTSSVETLNLPNILMSNFVKIIEMAMRSRMDCVDSEGSIYSKEALENLKKNAWNRPILGIGKPGIGKTEIMRGTVARKLGVGIREVRLGSMQDSDITGLPTFEEVKLEDGSVTKFTTFANLRALPHTKSMGGDDPDFGILVLDEITTCNEQVRTVALQLLDSSRSIGESYHLPPGWLIVALGNGPDDGADYAGMPETVISRMSGYYVQPDIDSWYEWASQNGIHDVVLGYLKQNKDALYHITESEGGYGVQITNPRTWEATSDALRVAERYSPGHKIEEDLIAPICSAGIGDEMGSKLAIFYSNKKYIIPMNEVLNGTAIKKYSPREIRIEALYLAQQAFVREYLEIGEKYAKELGSGATTKLSFSLKSTNKTTQDTSSDKLPDEAVKKLVNLTNFILYCQNPAIPAGLGWAIETIESITKACTYSKNNITKYMAQPNSKFYSECKEFNKFISEHKELLKLLHSTEESYS